MLTKDVSQSSLHLRQNHRLHVAEREQVLQLGTAAVDVVRGDNAAHSARLVIILGELERRLQRRMLEVKGIVFTIVRVSHKLVETDRVHGLIVFELDTSEQIEVAAQVDNDGLLNSASRVVPVVSNLGCVLLIVALEILWIFQLHHLVQLVLAVVKVRVGDFLR